MKARQFIMSIKQKIALGSIASVLSIIATVYPNELKTSDRGLQHIAQWEQYATRTYLDSVGVPTIGLGATMWLDGKRPKQGQEATDFQAAQLFIRDIKVAEKCVLERLDGAAMPQSVFDASVSLIHNTGCAGATYNPKRKAKTNLRLQAEAHNWSQVCYRMGDFIYAGGRVSKGLVNRRTADQRLCLEDLPNVSLNRR